MRVARSVFLFYALRITHYVGGTMRYGYILPGGEIRDLMALAVDAEAAGWDGIFYWDGIYIEGTGPMYDPWVVLGAMAQRTQRIRLGAVLTPVSRRRPWKL